MSILKDMKVALTPIPKKFHRETNTKGKQRLCNFSMFCIFSVGELSLVGIFSRLDKLENRI